MCFSFPLSSIEAALLEKKIIFVPFFIIFCWCKISNNFKKYRNYKENANNSCLSIIIIENLEGVNNIDSILENHSVDIIYFGAYDLSQDLGITGDVYNKKLLSVVEPAIKKVLKANKYAGGFVPQNFEEIKLLFGLGINFITFDVDSHIINSRLSKIVNQFDQYLND